jgi:hypothetical protein
VVWALDGQGGYFMDFLTLSFSKTSTYKVRSEITKGISYLFHDSPGRRCKAGSYDRRINDADPICWGLNNK